MHVVHIWGKAFEYPHAHVMLKWDVLGDSFIKKCHSSRSHLCILSSSLPALSTPTADPSLNAASLKQNEFPYRLRSAKGRLSKILEQPRDTGGAPHCGCDCSQVTLEALDVRHSLTASAGK